MKKKKRRKEEEEKKKKKKRRRQNTLPQPPPRTNYDSYDLGARTAVSGVSQLAAMRR